MLRKKPIKTYKDLEVYQMAYELAMEIFKITKSFPVEERFSLTSQIRNSSRSIASNIAEGWAKRKFIKLFKRHLIDAIGSCEETKVWVDFSYDCGYITDAQHKKLFKRYEILGSKLYSLEERWQTF